MDEYKQIKATSKTGKEPVTCDGNNTRYTLLDFWRWSVSDILSNATRGRFAEFIVGTAIGLDPKNIREEWNAFDLTTNEGIKIEVKSASYIQSWYQKELSNILFSIRPSKYWDAETNIQCGEPKRHADVYVFCLLKHQDKFTVDPLKLEQWDFYILPTYRLDNYRRSQSSITINSLKKMGTRKHYNELRNEIMSAYEEQSQFKELQYRNKVKCPICNEKMVEIVYGFPSIETANLAEQRMVFIGGCCISEDSPDYHCYKCRKSFSKDFKTIFDEDDDWILK